MAIGSFLKDRRLSYGCLPVNLLDRSTLTPMARLLYGVLDSCGVEQLFPSLAFLAIRMGLHPTSTKAVKLRIRELMAKGFLKKKRRGAGISNAYLLTMPDYCWIESPELLEMASGALQEGERHPQRVRTAQARKAWQERRQKEKKSGFELDLNLGSASPYTEGQLTPTQGSGNPYPMGQLTQGGESADPPKNEAKNEVKGGVPPAASLGWEGFAPRVKIKTGRDWKWTEGGRQAAARISEAVKGVTLQCVQDNFLNNPFHEKRGYDIKKLAENLNEFMPTADQVRNTCKHQGSKESKEEKADGIYQVRDCPDCGKLTRHLVSPAMKELTGIDKDRWEAWQAARARGAGAAELTRILKG